MLVATDETRMELTSWITVGLKDNGSKNSAALWDWLLTRKVSGVNLVTKFEADVSLKQYVLLMLNTYVDCADIAM